MFYKDELPSDKKDFIKDNPLEFAVVLAEKFKGFSQYTTGFLKAVDKDGKEKIVNPIVYDIKDDRYFIQNGTRALSRYHLEGLVKKHPGLHNFSIEVSDISHLSYNHDVKHKMTELLSDFFNIKVTKEVIDKQGKKYNIRIVSNSDTSIVASLVCDSLYLFDGDKKIGYLNVKYTKEEYIKKTYGNLTCSEAKSDKQFINVATVDYSFLEDEYKNKGLGYVMYFHMAQHLENEGIKFRSSTLQSDYALRLWDGINKNWSSHIEKKKANNQNCSFLKMTQDLQLYFQDNTPKIKKLKIT